MSEVREQSSEARSPALKLILGNDRSSIFKNACTRKFEGHISMEQGCMDSKRSLRKLLAHQDSAKDDENNKKKGTITVVKTAKSQESSSSPILNSISKYSRRFIPLSHGFSPRKKWNKKNSYTSRLSLHDLIFKYKLDRFIKNIRAHSGLNDVSRLNLEKLKIINDQGASEKEILNEKAFTELKRKNREILKGKKAQKKSLFNPRIINILRSKQQNLAHYLNEGAKRLHSFIEENIPVFKPFKTIRIGWEILMLLLTAWNIYSATLMLSFGINFQESYGFWIPYLNHDISFNIFQIFCLLIYSLDIIIKFNTGIFQDGEAVEERRKIFMFYLKSGFLFDILGTVAFWNALVGGNNSKNIVFFLFFKIYPLKISFGNINEAFFNNHRKLDSLYQLIILLTKNLIVLHLFACIWHYQASVADFKNNWIVNQNLVDSLWSIKYLRSLYFIVVTMTTVGYGDISPSNDIEYVVAMSCMLIGSGMIGYSINSIGAILKRRNESDIEFRNKMQILNLYLKKNKVGESLKLKVRKYLEYIWKTENIANERQYEEILRELPNSLREELLTQSRIWALQKIFSGKFKNSTLSTLARNFSFTQHSKEELIFQEGDIDDDLLVIANGAVELVLNEGKQDRRKCMKLVTKQEGEIIGLTSFFLGTPKKCSAKAASNCSILRLNKAKFLEIVRENPEEYEIYCLLRDKIFLYNDLSVIGRKCHSCGELTHSLQYCPHLAYLPFKDIIIKKYLFSPIQKRQKFRRKLGRYKKFSLSKMDDVKDSVKQFQSQNINDLELFLENCSNVREKAYLKITTPWNLSDDMTSETKEKNELMKDSFIMKEDISFVEAKMKTLQDNIPFKNNQIKHIEFSKYDNCRPTSAEAEEKNESVSKFNQVLFIPYSQQENFSSVAGENYNQGKSLEEIPKMSGEINSYLYRKGNQVNFTEGLLPSLGNSDERNDQKDNYQSSKENTSHSRKKKVEDGASLSLEKENKEDIDIFRKSVRQPNSKGAKPFLPLFAYEFDISFSYSLYFPYNNKQKVLDNFRKK